MEIIEVIGSFGFPIAMCIFMGVEIHNMRQEFAAQLEKITSTHKEETDKLTEALNNNTLAMQKLTDYISRE